MQGVLCRYAVLDKLYDDREMSATESRRLLKDVIISSHANTVKIYYQIVDFQIRLATHYSRQFALQVLRDMVKADDWNTTQRQVAELEREGEKLFSVRCAVH